VSTGVLAEHQGPAAASEAKDYEPTPEEKRAIKYVKDLFSKARRHRSKYDSQWLSRYKMFRGKQWTEKRPSYRHSEVVNMIFEAIQSQVPILTDSRPRFEFLPQEPSDVEVAQILSEVAEHDWESGNWLFKLTDNIYDSHFYGTALGSMEWDPDAKDGLGSICFEADDIFYAFPDPEARGLKHKERCRFFIYAEPRDLDALKAKYPEHAKHMRSDLLDFFQGDKTELGDEVRFRSPVDDRSLIQTQESLTDSEHSKALEITCYAFPNDIDEVELSKENSAAGLDQGADGEKALKLRYPKGRKLVIAGGVLVFDGENPYDDGEFPYARLVNYTLPREFWGISEVEQLESPQKIYNKLISFALDVATLMGNPIWVVDNNSGVDTDNLFNAPGLIVEKNPNSTVERQEGVQLQPFILDLAERIRLKINDIHGAQESARGAKPEGVTAASAVMALQEAAQQRIRLKSRNVDAYLQDLGQRYKSRVFQFYTSPRVIRLTKNGNAERYFRFHVEPVEGAYGGVGRKISVREFVPTESGGFAESLESREYITQGDFDVRVSTGSSLPFIKEQKANLGFQLFDREAIDEEELLKSVEYPNYQQVLARVQQRKAQMALAEAGAAGEVPSGQPPPAA
jgi:hypothetical protein